MNEDRRTSHDRSNDEGAGTDRDFDTVVVLDFGSQYSQLIARRVREAGVYSILLPWDAAWEDVALPWGSSSRVDLPVFMIGSPSLPAWVLREDVPVLGICYGMQLIASALDGGVESAARREYGPATIQVTQPLHSSGICHHPWMCG